MVVCPNCGADLLLIIEEGTVEHCPIDRENGEIYQAVYSQPYKKTRLTCRNHCTLNDRYYFEGGHVRLMNGINGETPIGD